MDATGVLEPSQVVYFYKCQQIFGGSLQPLDYYRLTKPTGVILCSRLQITDGKD